MLTKDKPQTKSPPEAKSQIKASVPRMTKQAHADVIQIKPIECYNDNVAIILFENVQTEGLELPENVRFSDEGIIIGVGPGLPNSVGRTPLHCKVGETVIIDPRSGKNAHEGSAASFYAGKRIVFTIERNLICKSANQRPFEIV